MTQTTSPYALSEGELKSMSHKYKLQNIHLSDDISLIHTSAHLVNGSIFLIFQVPIMEEANNFYLYKITPMPLFLNNNSFMPNIDTNYVALSTHQTEYSIISHDEYRQCYGKHLCTAHDIRRPINKQSHCVVQTFFADKPICMVKNSTDSKPFYKLYGNDLFYSVKEMTPLHLRCPQRKTTTFTPHLVELKGQGQAIIAHGCTGTLPNDFKFTTLAKTTHVQLQSSPFMNLMNELPDITSINIFPTLPQPLDKHIFTLRNITDNSLSNIWDQLTKPTDNLAHFVRFIAIVLVITTIALFLCCCSKTIRLWFKTCIFWKNPKEWWTKKKGYELPTFNKNKGNTKETNTQTNKPHNDIETIHARINEIIDSTNLNSVSFQSPLFRQKYTIPNIPNIETNRPQPSPEPMDTTYQVPRQLVPPPRSRRELFEEERAIPKLIRTNSLYPSIPDHIYESMSRPKRERPASAETADLDTIDKKVRFEKQ